MLLGSSPCRASGSKNRGNDRLHVSANVRAVVLEDFRNPLDVCRTRVAGYQVLNQLLGNERWKIRMIKNVVERAFHILLGQLPPGNNPPAAASE